MRKFIATPAIQRQVLLAFLVVGLMLRLIFIGNDGYTNDISTFEAWTLTLRDFGFGGFYGHAGFADYPPGYLYVLGLLAAIYRVIGAHDVGYVFLHVLVKLPGVIFDLLNACIAYKLAMRFAPRYALGAAAAILFNPATIAISAVWGQVDSVSAFGALCALWLVDGAWRGILPRRAATIGGWVVLACSVLIKPAALMIAPLFLALPFTPRNREQRVTTLVDAGFGVATALVVTYILAAPFAPMHDLIGCMRWLVERYQFGSSVYQYNTVNAFNLYGIASKFWLPDTTSSPLTFGLPLVVWGMGLVVIAIGACVARFVRAAAPEALLEAAFLVSLAFFAFATRMHERYVFTALMLVMPLVTIARSYILAMVLLSGTLFLNLLYSLAYLSAMTHPQPGVDVRDLMPMISHTCSFLVVMIFMALAFRYFGWFDLDAFFRSGSPTVDANGEPIGFLAELRASPWLKRSVTPGEGFGFFTRLDTQLAIGLSIMSFMYMLVNYWVPTTKIFDEIYYARSGAEYLRHIEQYEWTHPPVTKLVITLSMILFGGYPHGDTSAGWRFLNLVVGALMVGLLYRFVKRVSGSTFAAACAAFMLGIDGFHFAQSRIATPEITVAFFALLTLTVFYEYWIAAQVRRVVMATPPQLRQAIIVHAIVAVLTFAVGFGLRAILIKPTDPMPYSLAASIALIVYCELGTYLLTRYLLIRRGLLRVVTSYPDGSYVAGAILHRAEGEPPEQLAIGVQDTTMTFSTTARNGETVGIRCDADGTMTGAGLREGWTTTNTPHTADRLLILVAVSAGLLGASKWNGLFDLLLIWAIMICVSAAPLMPLLRSALGYHGERRLARWGNPFGFSLDLNIGLTLFVGATIYLLSYMPYFGLQHDFVDVVTLQHSMYQYHHDLRATHPYQSEWWQWPLLQRPISYYYTDFRTGLARNDGNACCVAEILALPNPIIWWAGLVSIPLVAFLGWRERRKGYALIGLAYLAQWLPWIASPRIAFEYHFFPNLALICAANALLLERLWTSVGIDMLHTVRIRRGGVIAFGVLSVAAAIFWYPLVSGTPISYNDWHARILDWTGFLHWI